MKTKSISLAFVILLLAAAALALPLFKFPKISGSLDGLLMLPAITGVRSSQAPLAEARNKAGISLTAVGLPVTQDFNTLATSGTGNAWSDDATLTGLYSQFTAVPTNPTVYIGDAGTSTTGGIHSYGVALTNPITDRALGSLASGGTGAIYNAVKVTNNTGATITSLNVSYVGEQWRNGGNTTQQQLEFQYQIANVGIITDANTPSTGWVDFDPLDFVGPVATATASQLDGNASGNRTPKSASVPVTIGAGQDVWFRWIDIDNSGGDHALAVDDISVTAAGPPVINLSASTYIEDESQTMVVTVQRSGSASGSSTVQLTTAGGNALGGTCAAGADYESQASTVTFTGSESTKTVNISICPDILKELPESFDITLSDPVNATLGSPSIATGNINDAASQFRNSNPIVINESGTAMPYPSTIDVAGASNLNYMRVTLFDVAADAADDIDVLLVSPGGQSFVLMADAGGSGGIAPGTTLTFNDNATSFLPDAATLASGSYKPSSWEDLSSVFVPPAPAGPYAEPGPGGSPTPRSALMNSVFSGSNLNGTWSLFVIDDTAGPIAMAPGSIAGGWGMEMIAPTAAALQLSGRVTDSFGRGLRGVTVRLEGGGLAVPRIALTGSFGYYSFEGLSSGTYVVTVSAKRYMFAIPSRMFPMQDSVFDADFVAEPPQ